jgi:hypothetical protein
MVLKVEDTENATEATDKPKQRMLLRRWSRGQSAAGDAIHAPTEKEQLAQSDLSRLRAGLSDQSSD